MFILFVSTISMITLFHYETILAVHLTQDIGLDEEYLGLFFSSQTICYTLFSYVIAQITSNELNYKLIIIGFFLNTLGNILIGPSLIFGILP